MNPTDAEIAGKLQAIINSINENTHWAWIKDELRFILRNLDAEPPKPTGDQLKRTCGNCGMPAKDCGVSKFSREACEAVPTWCKEWTPKEPEPVVKENLTAVEQECEPIIRVCEQCGAVARNSLVNICSSCGGGFVKPKEPKAEPGLIGCKIIGGKGNELWIVDMPWGNSIALYKAVGRKDFDHIETKNGLDFEVLGAFNPNDPPVRAWFRGAKGTPSPI